MKTIKQIKQIIEEILKEKISISAYPSIAGGEIVHSFTFGKKVGGWVDMNSGKVFFTKNVTDLVVAK